jgi:hypothetical protein
VCSSFRAFLRLLLVPARELRIKVLRELAAVGAVIPPGTRVPARWLCFKALQAQLLRASFAEDILQAKEYKSDRLNRVC